MEYIKIGDKTIAMKVIASGSWLEKSCYLCGKYFKKDDEIALVIPPSNLRSKYKKMSKNQVMHVDELESLILNCETIEDVLDVLENQKKAKKETLNEEQLKRINTFIKAAYNCGYRKVTKNTSGIVSCKQNGTSDKVSYNVYSDHIIYGNNRKRQLGDGFIDRGKATNIYNEFHKLLEDGKYDDYNPLNAFLGAVADAVETTNKIMGS